VVWLKRADSSTRDTWRFDLNLKTFGNCFTADPELFSPNRNPVLYGLSKSWHSFYREYLVTNNNFKTRYLLNNPLFYELEKNFFLYKHWNAAGTPSMFHIAKLKLCDCFDLAGKFKTLADLNNTYSINIPLVTYFRLRLAVDNLLKKLPVPNSPISVPVRNFLNQFKKGSKRIRNIMTNSKSNDNVLPELVGNYFKIAGITVENPSTFPWQSWALSFLPNDLRDFLYKYFYNKLGLNSRTFHFGGETRECTFCAIVIRVMGPVPKETFQHLFFECPPIKHCHEQIFDAVNNANSVHNNNVWSGQECPDLTYQLFYFYVQFHIWQCKKQQQFPSVDWLLGESFYLLDTLLAGNKSLMLEFDFKNSILCRLWRRLKAPRW
jgi:hypothetical protein